MALVQAKALAAAIVRLAPIIIEATQLVKKWRKRDSVPAGDVETRVQRLERNMDLQARLNEQFIAEMKMLGPALESVRRLLRLCAVLALIAGAVSLAALIAVLMR